MIPTIHPCLFSLCRKRIEMPFYTYTNLKTGENITVRQSKPNPRKTVVRKGIKFHKNTLADHSRTTKKLECWPMKCTALGVIPQQVEEATKQAFDLGCPTGFYSDGDAKIRDRGHYNKFMDALGYHNRDACFGDKAPP